MTERRSRIARLWRNKDRNAVLICLGIATTFWLSNALSEEYTHDYTYNLEYNLRENLSFYNTPREQVVARLSGQGWELLKASLPPSSKRLEVDVVRPELTRSDLIAALYSHLSGYDVVVREVNTDLIQLEYDIRMTKEVPVTLDSEFAVAEGYFLRTGVELQPSTVLLDGPSNILERISSLDVKLPELDSLSADYSATALVRLPGNPYISVEPTEVNVSIGVDALIQLSRKVNVEVFPEIDSATTDPPDVDCTLTLGRSFAGSDSIALIRAYVEYAEGESDSLLPVKLQYVPGFVLNYRCNPNAVSISFGQDSL